MYRRILDGRTLSFDHTGYVYLGSFVMFDTATESEWLHVTAECLRGPLKGRRLEVLPARLLLWREWKALHPSTSVMARLDPWISQPSDIEADFDWDAQSKLGLNVYVGGDARLYPYEHLRNVKAIEDQVGETPVLVAFLREANCGVAWSRKFENEVLEFEVSPHENKLSSNPRSASTSRVKTISSIRDRRTNTEWDLLTGRGISGLHKDKQLRPLPAVAIQQARFPKLFASGTIYQEKLADNE